MARILQLFRRKKDRLHSQQGRSRRQSFGYSGNGGGSYIADNIKVFVGSRGWVVRPCRIRIYHLFRHRYNKGHRLSLLGQPPKKEFVKQIEDEILSYPNIVGVHDLIIHDYGPGRQFASAHAEVPQALML